MNEYELQPLPVSFPCALPLQRTQVSPVRTDAMSCVPSASTPTAEAPSVRRARAQEADKENAPPVAFPDYKREKPVNSEPGAAASKDDQAKCTDENQPADSCPGKASDSQSGEEAEDPLFTPVKRPEPARRPLSSPLPRSPLMDITKLVVGPRAKRAAAKAEKERAEARAARRAQVLSERHGGKPLRMIMR